MKNISWNQLFSKKTLISRNFLTKVWESISLIFLRVVQIQYHRKILWNQNCCLNFSCNHVSSHLNKLSKNTSLSPIFTVFTLGFHWNFHWKCKNWEFLCYCFDFLSLFTFLDFDTQKLRPSKYENFFYFSKLSIEKRNFTKFSSISRNKPRFLQLKNNFLRNL